MNKLKVGVFEGKVVSICPDREELSKLTGTTIKKEIDYKTQKGVKVVAAIKDVASDFLGFVTFELEKDDLKYNSGKYSYKNRLGFTLAFEKDRVSPGFYMNGDVTICKKGEPELLNFLRNWLYIDNDGAIEYKIGKLFDGNFSELKNLVNSSITRTLCCAAVVKTDMNNKTSNLIYNKAFTLGKEIEHFKSVYSNPYLTNLVKLKNEKKKLEPFQEFIWSIGNPNYPCPYFHHIGPLKVYIHEENPISSNKSGLK